MDKLIFKRIKTLRYNAGLSQQEISRKLNISQSTYQRIERGKGSTWSYYLESIASFFGIDEKELFLDTNHKVDESNQTARIDLNNHQEKMLSLYESLLSEKDKNCLLLEKLLHEKEKYIDLLENLKEKRP